MAKNMQPIVKRCRALGISPAAMGYAGKSKQESNRNPGGQMRKKKSEYALQLTEKQKVKFVYGIMEKQFRSYYEKAARMPGKTGENLLVLVERRLDNVIEVKESSRSSAKFKRLTGEDAPTVLVPKWLERDKNALKGTVLQMPTREDIDLPVEEHLIVELYSK